MTDETVLVNVTKVTEHRTKPDWHHRNGRRRFEIEALHVSDPTTQVWCSTLDPAKADVCQRYEHTSTPVQLTVRPVILKGRFGATSKMWNLVAVKLLGVK